MLKPLGEEISFRSFYIACKGNDFSGKLSVPTTETSNFLKKISLVKLFFGSQLELIGENCFSSRRDLVTL